MKYCNKCNITHSLNSCPLCFERETNSILRKRLKETSSDKMDFIIKKLRMNPTGRNTMSCYQTESMATLNNCEV